MRVTQIFHVLLVVDNDRVDVERLRQALRADDLEHHLHRLGVAVDQGNDREGVRADPEFSRRARTRQRLVRNERSDELKSPSALTGPTTARYCRPASATAADTGANPTGGIAVLGAVANVGAVAEVVGLVVRFAPQFAAEPADAIHEGDDQHACDREQRPGAGNSSATR